MNYKKMLDLISKPWIDTDGIMKLAQCGKNSAIKVRIAVEQQVIKNGKQLPLSSHKSVPTKLVLDYLGLDEEYIYDMAKKLI